MSWRAVRDALLGLPVKDRDWVVVGSTPEGCSRRLPPVGRDSVFIPHTNEEYALAHRSAVGHACTGFVCHASPGSRSKGATCSAATSPSTRSRAPRIAA